MGSEFERAEQSTRSAGAEELAMTVVVEEEGAVAGPVAAATPWLGRLCRLSSTSAGESGHFTFELTYES